MPDNVLPPGAMLTGTWSFNGAGNGEQYVPLSFPIQLASGLIPSKTHLVGSTGEGTCTGTSQEPTAPPGELCVYKQEVEGATSESIVSVPFGNGVNKIGGFILFEGTGATDYGYGSWAVTGCAAGHPEFPCP